MEMEITFPGGARVDANFGPYTVKTDQPPMGGGPLPHSWLRLEHVLVSMCSGFFVNAACRRMVSGLCSVCTATR